MERFCSIIKPMARSKSQIDSSISNGILKLELLTHIEYGGYLDTAERILQPQPPKPCLLNAFEFSLTRQQQRSLRQMASSFFSQSTIPNFSKITAYRRYCLGPPDLIVGSDLSQRRGDINRASHQICFQEPGTSNLSSTKRRAGVIYLFAEVSPPGKLAWISELEGVAFDRRQAVASVGRVGRKFWIPVEWITNVIGLIKEGGLNIIVGDFPELYGA